MNQNLAPDEARLRELLRGTRPTAELSPGFQDHVWRRIARAEADPSASSLDGISAFVAWLLQPRRAMAGLTAFLLLGGFLGTLAGLDEGRALAQARYVAAIAPPAIQ